MGSFLMLALFALVAGVGIVALIEAEPGYLMIAYAGYTVESSFWVGMLLIATVVLCSYALLRLLRQLISSPASFFGWSSERRRRRAVRSTRDGLVSFMEGNWARARKQLLRGAKHSELPLQNYLLAARASHRLQEPEAARSQLLKAEQSDAQASIAIDLTQAELELEARQYDKALLTLERLQKRAGRYPQTLKLLWRCHDGRGDLDALAGLLPQLRRHKVFGALELDELEARTHHDLLEQAAVRGDAQLLNSRWKQCPSRLRESETMLLHYLGSLLACEETVLLEREIEKRLNSKWQPALVNLYGRVPRDSAQDQIVVAEGWLKLHESDPDVLLCLGRLAMVERQWSRARELLERSQASRPSEETCLELGRLLAAVGEHAAAAEAFRTSTTLRGQPLPELPQPDDVVPAARRLPT